MSSRTHAKPVGMYIACGGDPDDAIILLGQPEQDIPRLSRRQNLRVKSVAPGINIEKVKGRITGVRLYPPVMDGDFAYSKIGKTELRRLQQVSDQLTPTLAGLRRRIRGLTKRKKLKR